MANKTIHDLSQFIGITSDAELAVYDVASATTKKVSLGELLLWLGANGLVPEGSQQAADSHVWGITDDTLSSPPASPQEGSNYLVASGASGDWAGHDGEVASYRSGSWVFTPLGTGDVLWIIPTDKMFVVDDAGLLEITNQPIDPNDLNFVPMIGVNASVSTDERFKVTTKRAVFDNEGSNPLEVVINRTAATDRAWLVLAENMVFHWRIGEDGAGDLVFEASSDGTTFTELLKIRKNNGNLVFSAAATIESDGLVGLGSTNYVIDAVAANSTDVAGFKASKGSAGADNGFSITDDGTYQLRIDLHQSGGTRKRVLHVASDGTWNSDAIMWVTPGIVLAPASGDVNFVLARPNTSSGATLTVETAGGDGWSQSLTASGDWRLSWTASGTSTGVADIRRSDNAWVPAAGKQIFAGDVDVVDAGASVLTVAEEVSGKGLTIYADSSIIRFSYGDVTSPAVLFSVDHATGKILADGFTFSDTTNGFDLVLEGDNSSMGLNGKYQLKVSGDDLVISNTGGIIVRYSGGIWNYQSYVVAVDSGNGTASFNSSITATGQITAQEVVGNTSVSSPLLRAYRTNPTDSDVFVVAETTGTSPIKYQLGMVSGSNNFRLLSDESGSPADVFAYTPSNSQFTFYRPVTFDEATNNSTPFVKAYDDTTRSYGANTEETVTFGTVIDNDKITISPLGDVITVEDYGVYHCHVWLKFQSVDTNNSDVWEVAVELAGSSDILNEPQFARFAPAASGTAGTETFVDVAFVARLSAGAGMRIKVRDIGSQADLVLSRVEIVRGF